MYSDTITLFNRYEQTDGIMWYPTILEKVDLNVDRAAVIARYGEQTADNAMLHVRCRPVGADVYIGEKLYLPPKLWANQNVDELAGSVTFTGGVGFDFFIAGRWEESEPISDNEFLDGLYNYMNKRYDYVFSISSVALYSVIPHFEIAAK